MLDRYLPLFCVQEFGNHYAAITNALAVTSSLRVFSRLFESSSTLTTKTLC